MLLFKILIRTALLVILPAGVYTQAQQAGAADVTPTEPLRIDSLEHVTDKELPDWYDFVGNLPRDFGAFAGVVVDAKTIPTIVGLSALTIGLVATDHRTYKYSRNLYERSGAVSSVSDILVSVGDGTSSLILAGAFGVYGFATSDRRAIRTASQTLEALLATGLLVQTFKYISGRESPGVATSEGGRWRPFPNFKADREHQSEYYAFPSGHIATTMATVTVIAENYPEQGWIRPVGYSLVGLVGIGLVNYRWHWYSDLPLGIAVGYAFGMIVAHPGGSDEIGSSETDLTVTPMVNGYGSGFNVSLRF